MSAAALRKTIVAVLILIGMGVSICRTWAREKPDAPTKDTAPRTRTDRYGDPLPPGALMRLGAMRLRHPGMKMAFSADGKTLLSFSARERTIRHWDLVSGRETRCVSLHGAEQWKRPFLSAWNEKSVVLGTGEQLVLWDAATGKERRRIEPTKATLQALALSPSGDTLAVAMQADQVEAIRLWDTRSGKELPRLDHPVEATELSFSPDGKLLGAVGLDNDLRIWEVPTGKLIRTIRGAGQQIAFSPDGSQVALVGREGREAVVKVWSVADGREVAVLPKVKGASYFEMHFSADGKRLVTGGSPDALLFDVAGRTLLRRFPNAGWIALAPDGKTLASGLCAIHLWDTTTGREIHPCPGHEGPVSVLAVTPDGGRIASLSSWDAFVHLWGVASGKSVVVLPAGDNWRDLHVGVLSSDGKRFASGATDGKVRVWDLGEAREVRQFHSDLRNAQGLLNPDIIALSFSAENRQLAAVSMAWHTLSGFRPKYQLDLWDLDSGKSLARRALSMESWPACFDATGRTVVFRTGAGLVVQDVKTGQEWARLSGGVREPFALSPNGKILAATVYEPKPPPPGEPLDSAPRSTDARAIVLMELASGKQLLRIETGANGFSRLAFAPDGRTLATVDDDGFRLWDAATGKELFRRVLPRKSGMLGYPFATSLAFLPGGDRLATGLMDGTTLIWDLEPKTWRAGVVVKDLDGRDLERLWADLASDDAGKAHRAVWTLAAAPSKAVPFLKDHLHPVASVDAKEVQRLLGDLDSEQFAVRAPAGKKLAALGEQTEPALRQALEGKPSLEVRKRLEALRANAILVGHGRVRSAEVLRTLRAIRSLEYIGSAEARKVLQTLADGDPAARSTRCAQETLRRLQRRAAVSPEPSGVPQNQTRTPPPARP
ncbi:MAG TPA: WD40 repeat domain-containing protein [Gemmataceae bacterium]